MSEQNPIKPDHFEKYTSSMSKLSKDPLLVKKVVNRLKEEKMIVESSFLIRYKWLIAACISFFCFSAGYQVADIANDPFEPNYIILLLEDEEFNPPEDINLVHSYGLWMTSVLDDGVKIQGNQLSNLADTKSFRPTIDRAEVTGYFFLRSESEDQVLKIAESMPHYKFGGKISLKKINP